MKAACAEPEERAQRRADGEQDEQAEFPVVGGRGRHIQAARDRGLKNARTCGSALRSRSAAGSPRAMMPCARPSSMMQCLAIAKMLRSSCVTTTVVMPWLAFN